MSADELRRLSGNPTQWMKFVKSQHIIAEGFVRHLRSKFYGNSCKVMPSEMPDAKEVFNEAYIRIIEKRRGYVWDGNGSFNSFFARCMRAACNSLRDGERRHTNRQVEMTPSNTQVFPEEQDELVANRQYEKALVSAILETRMTGQGAKYALRLPLYVVEKWETSEIAKDLGVKEVTVPSYRARLSKNKNFNRALKKDTN